MYPHQGIDNIHPAIPLDIASDWKEAQQCFAAGAVKGAAMLARRVLYGVLMQKGYKEHPLNAVLKTFIAAERLPAIFDSWVTAIRDDGADAAHPYRALTIDTKDIAQTMEYTAELLRFAYVEPAEFAKRIAQKTSQVNAADGASAMPNAARSPTLVPDS